MDKLKWEFNGDYQVTWHNGYRIRAVRDDNAENPFEQWDGNWPIIVYYDGRLTEYDKTKSGTALDSPLSRFGDEALVHNQIAIAELLGTTIRNVSIDYDYPEDSEEPVNYIWDADILRYAFERELESVYRSQMLDVLAALYDLLGIPNLCQTTRGYCQDNWAEVLVVATPEACVEFGHTYAPIGAGQPDAHIAAWWEHQLQGTIDLYGAWAWGDVYGYVVEFAIYDEDGEVEDWEEVDSCWGFYGDDHHESGLEEAALDAVPDEPAPGFRSDYPNTLLEVV